MVPQTSIRKSFGGFFREDFAVTVIMFWNYFLPSTLFLVCSCFGKLLCYCCFSNMSLKPNLVTFFPSGDASYPSWGRFLLLSSALFRRSPSVGVNGGNGCKTFDSSTTPINVGSRGFEEGIAQDKIILSNIRDKECVRGFSTIVID